MKKMILALVMGSSLLVLPKVAEAQTRPGLEIGAEYFDYGYKEFDQGALFIEDSGSLFGLHFSYVQPITRSLFFRGILAGAVGESDYDPQDEPVIRGIEQRSGRFELQLGYDVMLGEGASVTPFLGYGYRLHEDLAQGVVTESGLIGFDREHKYHYIPVGVAAGVALGGRKRLTVSSQYNHLIAGETTGRLSRIDPEIDDFSLDFNGGRGLEASAMLSLPVGRRSVINVGPFIRHWDLDESDSLTIVNPDDPTESIILTEPENRTTEVGLRVSFGF